MSEAISVTEVRSPFFSPSRSNCASRSVHRHEALRPTLPKQEAWTPAAQPELVSRHSHCAELEGPTSSHSVGVKLGSAANRTPQRPWLGQQLFVPELDRNFQVHTMVPQPLAPCSSLQRVSDKHKQSCSPRSGHQVKTFQVQVPTGPGVVPQGRGAVPLLSPDTASRLPH